MKEKRTGGQFRTSIGGQALIEGILMRGPKKQAIVVRSPEGLVREVEGLRLVKDKYPILGWPIIRGAVTFVDSMVRGVKALMFSADYFPELEESEAVEARPLARGARLRAEAPERDGLGLRHPVAR
ncbi:MAG: DUF1385 domain-containing protein [Oscillospiraceae bacterium]